MTTRKITWEPGCLVQCPCCGNKHETDDYVPFDPTKYDLHSGAERLLKAAVAMLKRLGDNGNFRRTPAYKNLLDAVLRCQGAVDPAPPAR